MCQSRECFVLVTLIIAFVLAGTPRRTLAADAGADAKVQARAKLMEGGELLKAGEYTDALARFKEAYTLVPSPKIFYNFGLAYMNLGRKTEAVESFEKFLDEATDAAPDNRANAERLKSQLVPWIASVVVQCETEGAEISVAGRPYGTTPRKNPVRLDPGLHSLVVEKAPTPAFTKRLEVKAGERVTVEVKLEIEKPAEVVIAPPITPPPPIVPPEPPKTPWSWKKKAALGTGIASLGALTFGVIEQLAASSKYGQFNDYTMAPNPLGKCDKDPRVTPPKGGGDCASLLSAGDSASVLAKVGLIAGGLLAAGSVTLFVLSRKDATESSETAFAGCVPTGPGVNCALRF